MIISKSTGLFGDIWLLDDSGKRMLSIGHQVQGSCYHQPAGPEGIVPGPVAASTYMLGWLLAGASNPNSSGLMIGLGSGCGAVALLNSCPGVDLTVVEIDPAIVEMAHQGFPLLDYYQDQGRLQIVTDDATAYLAQADQRDTWDLCLADAYCGSNDAHLPEELLYHLCQRCTHLWLNCIDAPGGRKIAAAQHYLALAGKPVVWTKPLGTGTAQQNIILSTQVPEVAGFVAYPDCEGATVEAARAAVAHLAQG